MNRRKGPAEIPALAMGLVDDLLVAESRPGPSFLALGGAARLPFWQMDRFLGTQQGSVDRSSTASRKATGRFLRSQEKRAWHSIGGKGNWLRS